MAAGVVQIPWYATLFRGDKFAAAVAEIAPVAMRYGATDYIVYRNRDDMYKFMQMARPSSPRRDFEAYWYGPEIDRLRDDLLGLVPGADPLHVGRRRDPGRATATATARPGGTPRAAEGTRLAELAAPPGQPHVELVQWRGLDHRVGVLAAAGRGCIRPSPRRSRPRRARPRARPARRAPRARVELRPASRRAEVRHGERLGRPGADRRDRRRSQAAMSMSGGGVGATVKRVRRDARAADVADERDARGRVQVGDVVRGVAGRVLDAERPPPVSPPLSTRRFASGTGTNSPHSSRRPSSPPYSRPADASSFAGSTMCGAPRSCT